jgi:hypothetical protein
LTIGVTLSDEEAQQKRAQSRRYVRLLAPSRTSIEGAQIAVICTWRTALTATTGPGRF